MGSSGMRTAWLLASALAIGCDGSKGAGGTSSQPPDIVLVSIDSLRFDHLGCYGYPKPTAPTIDRLALDGVRFETAISTTSWTLPAHAAMLTGLFDSAHGVVDNGLRLSENQRTLTEVLHDAGWRTAGFFGGPYLDPAYGFGQGFDHYESCMSPGAEDSHRDVTGPRTVEATARWLDEELGRSARRPFFLFLHLWDVHYDYIPPPGYAERFDPDYAGDLDASDLPRNPAVEPGMSPRDFTHLLALYDGEIRFTDDNLGRILEEIDRRGRLRDALVIVTADHGEEFFEHGGKGHQKTLFDEVVRVPLVVRWPGHLPAGKVVRDPVRIIDIMPTVLALAGVAERPATQGRDLGRLMVGDPVKVDGTLEPAPALLELLVDGNDVRGLRTAREKVLCWRHLAVSLLYDLVLDPREGQPISAGSEELPRALARLDRAVSEAAAFRSGGSPQAAEIGPDLKRRLGVLGYAGGGAGPPHPPRK